MSLNNPQDHPSQLRKNVKLLGALLGDIISDADGVALFEKVEAIRRLSKSARAGSDFSDLQNLLSPISNAKALTVARAFGQFLTLANIADQHHTISGSSNNTAQDVFADTINALKQVDNREKLEGALESLHINLVLTAHPTEIIRRTMINKYAEIDHCLSELSRAVSSEDQAQTLSRLRSLIMQIWHSRDFRVQRPSPIDEAKGGYAVVERSLWQAAPQYLRQLDRLRETLGLKVAPIATSPLTFSSWMGGDRDGNPNVTAEVTQQTLLLSQWQATDLFSYDVNRLIEELSVTECNQRVRAIVGEQSVEPYRSLLRPLRDLLETQRDHLKHAITSGKPAPLPLSREVLSEPLEQAYDSLRECGMSLIAQGHLLDTLRRVAVFGPHLVTLDVRQESSRHSDAMAEIVTALGLGDYKAWSEEQKCAFLMQELFNARPLLPRNFIGSPEVTEVLDTMKVIASNPRAAFGAYVISMASCASDVLAVHLLLKEAGCPEPLPVSPLFETLSDLENARPVIEQLLNLEGFSDYVNHHLMVMIGYSDSAKDAGVLAASWAQYRAQESLVELCAQNRVALTLFHGRGGTIGRGGAPAKAALMSQPPGSLAQGLRVTEQGEMIRTKLGLPKLAEHTLALYTSAILQANVTPPPSPNASWRTCMDSLAALSCDHYRSYVRNNPRFLEYFREATPEQELANLPLGSRPARRRAGGGIETLRAIPWIFAWSQNRLLLPAWLGAGAALTQLWQSEPSKQTIQDMASNWPFFATRLSMLEMVFAKADLQIAEYYDSILVSESLLPMGAALRSQLLSDSQVLLDILGQSRLLENDSWGHESIRLRNIYTAPLNLLQAELLKRERLAGDPEVEQGIMVSIAGIAAGMRNTG